MTATQIRPARAAGGPSLGELRQGLIAPAGRPFTMPAWLSASPEDPDAFWRMAAPLLLAAPGGTARSSLFERYNLFHELGARHAEPGRIALRELDPGNGYVESSYTAIVERAACLARAWRHSGLTAGTTVAVVASFGGQLLVALLAAWRCGAIAAPIPALGRAFVRNRIDALAPDFVATSEGRAAWLRIEAEQSLPLTPPRDGLPDRDPPHLWAAGDVALRCFSPLGQNALAVHEVAAEPLLLGALRDGLLLLALESGQTIAAPGFCELQEKIPLMLAALAAGACWVELSLEAACADPDDLLARVEVLGVHDDLRDEILSQRPRGRLRRWFRNPAAEPAYDAWERLAGLPLAERALGTSLFVNTAAAGAIVCAPWRANPGRNQALLAPGRPWRLFAAGLRQAESLGDHGVLACAGDVLPPDALGRPVLARAGGEYLWVTSLDTHRRGQRLPAGEICAAVSEHPDVWRAALVDYPKGANGLSSGAALLVFVRPDAPALRVADLTDAISVELGEQFLPDRTDLLHVPSRTTKDGRVDESWARAQYVARLLALKEREPLFRALGRLRFALTQASPAGEG